MEAKFKLDDKVFVCGDRGSPGVITAIEEDNDPRNNIYHVTFENSNTTHRFEDDDLRTFDPEVERVLKAQVASRMRAMISKFEDAFESWQEIQDIADRSGDGIYSLMSDPDLKPLFDKFESTVEAGGWSSSSIYC